MSDSVSGKRQPTIGHKNSGKGTSTPHMVGHEDFKKQSVRSKDTKELLVNKCSEEYFEYSCDPCKTAGDHVEAQGFCSNCEEYLCDICFRSHSRCKASKHHTLLDKNAMPRNSVKQCDPCKSAEEEIEAVGYCKDCTEYLCVNCYKSHSRSKSSKHHVLVDKETMPEEYDNVVRSSIANMKIREEVSVDVKCNEEYIYIRDINIKADTDKKDCFVVAMVLVSNTNLVLCDRANISVKHVDVENDIIKDSLELQASPTGITAISREQVAVALENVYQIKIISIAGGLSVMRTIKTNGNCLGVTFTNGQLFASFREPVQFQILQLSGAISKTIKPDSEVLKHCTHPLHIVVSPDERWIYISDWKNNKVMCMDMEGNMVCLYPGELSKPYDVTISPFGSVYICNRDQHIVYGMTPDLKEATVILGRGDGLYFPHAMCKQHLYISSGSAEAKHKNFLKLFKLK